MNEKEITKKNALLTIAFVYVICSIVKYIEFFYIQTDRTFIADNVICKIFSIIVLAFALH